MPITLNLISWSKNRSGINVSNSYSNRFRCQGQYDIHSVKTQRRIDHFLFATNWINQIVSSYGGKCFLKRSWVFMCLSDKEDQILGS